LVTRFGSLRWRAALYGILGALAAGASSLGACTSGTTPDCGDAQCGVVVISDAQPESGDDGSSYTMESGTDDGGLEAGSMDAEGGSSGSDASDSGGSGDTGVNDANDGGSRDAPADG
jgi:hypothetical protein